MRQRNPSQQSPVPSPASQNPVSPNPPMSPLLPQYPTDINNMPHQIGTVTYFFSTLPVNRGNIKVLPWYTGDFFKSLRKCIFHVNHPKYSDKYLHQLSTVKSSSTAREYIFE